MESILQSIGSITVLAVLFYLLISYHDRKERKSRLFNKYLDLLGEDEKFEDFYDQHRNLSHEDALIKFYTIEENLTRAQRKMDERSKWEIERQDKEKKKYTLFRVFAYDYEDFVYSLYSPFAKPISSYKTDNKWTIDHCDLIPRSYIISKLSLYKHISKEKATEVFEELVKKELLFKYTSRYDIGLTLGAYANVISDSDMNLSKWIEKNGQSKTKEELEEDIKQFKLRNSLIYTP